MFVITVHRLSKEVLTTVNITHVRCFRLSHLKAFRSALPLSSVLNTLRDLSCGIFNAGQCVRKTIAHRLSDRPSGSCNGVADTSSCGACHAAYGSR
jgi:hypothetical protein